MSYPATFPLTYRICMEVATHEALVRQTYRDSVGVDTWSVGLTNATGHHVQRYIGKPQSVQHCLDVYVWALDRYADQVREVFKGHRLTEAQFAASLSFHWNTGAIRRASWVNAFKAGHMKQAEEQFMQWRLPPEIVPRRKKEADLLFRGRWSGNGRMPEYTRLTANRTPVWGSRIERDVMAEMVAAMDKLSGTPPVLLDSEPQPEAEVLTPTLSPEGVRGTLPSWAQVTIASVIAAFAWLRSKK